MPRMSETTDLNPYAPPKADPEGPSFRAHAAGHLPADLRRALERLDEHLSDPTSVAFDREIAGPRFRVVTLVFGALFVVSLVITLVSFNQTTTRALGLIGIGLSVFFGVVGLVLLALDASLVARDQPSTPDATLKAFFKSISLGRHGYGWAVLSPTAREQTVRAPALGDVDTGHGEFSMANHAGVKAYGASFARAGGGQMRTMAVKRIALGGVDGDIATVEAQLAFQSWPRWVSIVMAVCFVIFRPAVLIGAVLYFAMRKRHETRVTKTLLRGRNGAWYVYDAELLGG